MSMTKVPRPEKIWKQYAMSFFLLNFKQNIRNIGQKTELQNKISIISKNTKKKNWGGCWKSRTCWKKNIHFTRWTFGILLYLNILKWKNTLKWIFLKFIIWPCSGFPPFSINEKFIILFEDFLIKRDLPVAHFVLMVREGEKTFFPWSSLSVVEGYPFSSIYNHFLFSALESLVANGRTDIGEKSSYLLKRIKIKILTQKDKFTNFKHEKFSGQNFIII